MKSLNEFNNLPFLIGSKLNSDHHEKTILCATRAQLLEPKPKKVRNNINIIQQIFDLMAIISLALKSYKLSRTHP